ncbi:hypothetical protein YC2023_102208 [Brassica napus]
MVVEIRSLLPRRDARGDWNEFRAVNKLVKLRGIITAALTSWSVPCEVLQSPLLKTSYDEDETETVSVDVGTQVGKALLKLESVII